VRQRPEVEALLREVNISPSNAEGAAADATPLIRYRFRRLMH
jgi:hypothetical protein